MIRERSSTSADHYVGMTLAAARAQARSEQRWLQILDPEQTMVTMEFVADRVRLWVDDDRVIRATAG